MGKQRRQARRRQWPEHEHLVVDEHVLVDGLALAWVEVCSDPLCVTIHQSLVADDDSGPDRERPGASNSGPFSDPSDVSSEAAGGRHSTTT